MFKQKSFITSKMFERKSCFAPKMIEQMFPNILRWYRMTFKHLKICWSVVGILPWQCPASYGYGSCMECMDGIWNLWINLVFDGERWFNPLPAEARQPHSKVETRKKTHFVGLFFSHSPSAGAPPRSVITFEQKSCFAPQWLKKALLRT